MNSTAAPAPELGAFRPFGWARSPLATTFLVLTVVLVYWRRSYRPLNRRPLLMRSLATLWFVLQATGRSFVAACWITTCLSWLAELAMVMTVLSHTWQCFAYFRISQLHEQMRKNIKPTDEGFVLPVLLRGSLELEDNDSSRSKLAKTHAFYRKWSSTLRVLVLSHLLVLILWSIELLIGNFAVASSENLTIFDAHRTCTTQTFVQLNVAMGSFNYVILLVSAFVFVVLYRKELADVPDQLHIKRELVLMLLWFILQVVAASVLALLDQDWRYVVWGVFLVLIEATTIWPRLYETFLDENQPLTPDDGVPADEELAVRRPSVKTRERFPIRALEMELAHSAFREGFNNYLKAELTNELLMFAEKALSLLNRRQYGELSSSSVRALYAEFLARGAPLPINVSAALRTKFREQLEKDPDAGEMFDILRAAYTDVMLLLAFGRLPSFLGIDDESSAGASEDNALTMSPFAVLARHRAYEAELEAQSNALALSRQRNSRKAKKRRKKKQPK